MGILQTRTLEWFPCPPPGDLPNPEIRPRSPALQMDSVPAEPPGKPKNTGVGSVSLLQRIFPTQSSNPSLPHCRQILDHLSHQGSPRILEWVAYPFSRGSSPPRDRTQVSCIAGRILNRLRHQGSPRIQEWVAYPFSRGSSRPRTGGFFTR